MDMQSKPDCLPRSAIRVWLTAALLWVGTLAFLLLGIATPNNIRFDENFYVPAARSLHAGTGEPTPYGPPLGLLLVSQGIRFFGDSPVGWRIPGAALGALTVVGAFLLTYLLLSDYALALTAAILALTNNMLYVLSRIAMMDIYLVAFAIWGILAFVAAVVIDRLEPLKRRALLISSGVLFGFSCASKWNGVDSLGVVFALGVLLYFWPGFSKNSEMARLGANLRQAGGAWFASSLILVPAIAYTATFWLLSRSLALPCTWERLVSLNRAIWEFHRTYVTSFSLAEPWYKWPLQTQPMRVLSYLVGNWYVMWAGLVALLFCLRRFARSLPETLIVLLYAANLLQWSVTPQQLLYYYYYLPCAMFLSLAIPVALHRLPTRYYGVRLSVISVLPAVCVFLYCLPHMAGLSAPYDTMFGYWP